MSMQGCSTVCELICCPPSGVCGSAADTAASQMAANAPRVLISGASVAGPVLAYWLSRFGFQTTVVEQTERLGFGTGGHAVDLFGPALLIIEWMGALQLVQNASTHTDIISFIRQGGQPVDVPAALGAGGVSERHAESMPGE